MEEKYNKIVKSLSDYTLYEKLKEVQERIFIINMSDHWETEDYKTVEALEKIENELKEEIYGKK